MALNPEDERVLAVMRGLNASADSIVAWINEIGALRQAHAALRAQLHAVQEANARGRIARATIEFDDGSVQEIGEAPPADRDRELLPDGEGALLPRDRRAPLQRSDDAVRSAPHAEPEREREAYRAPAVPPVVAPTPTPTPVPTPVVPAVRPSVVPPLGPPVVVSAPLPPAVSPVGAPGTNGAAPHPPATHARPARRDRRSKGAETAGDEAALAAGAPETPRRTHKPS